MISASTCASAAASRLVPVEDGADAGVVAGADARAEVEAGADEAAMPGADADGLVMPGAGVAADDDPEADGDDPGLRARPVAWPAGTVTTTGEAATATAASLPGHAPLSAASHPAAVLRGLALVPVVRAACPEAEPDENTPLAR